MNGTAIYENRERMNKMNYTIQHLYGICEAHRFDEKLLFVPSYSIGHQIGEDLARKKGSWINLRMTTVGGFAQELVGADMGKEGIRLIDSHEHFVIVEEVLREASLDQMGSYFEGAKDIPGIVRCLAETINELRMAGIRTENINPDTFLVPKKGREIMALLDSYEAFFTGTGRTDRAGLITRAIHKLQERQTFGPERLFMVLSDFTLTPIEKTLIQMAGGRNLWVIQHSKPLGLSVPRGFFDIGGQEMETAIEPKADIQLLPWLNEPGNAPPPFGDGSVTLFHALGESNEVREVFRKILAQGLSSDDVEILVTKTDPYVSTIHEITCSLDIPLTFSGGIPVSYTRPGKALVLYFKWQLEDFAGKYMNRLFSGGYIDLDRIGSAAEKPSSGKAAAMIRKAGIGWGRERYGDRLKVLAQAYLARARKMRENGKEKKAEWMERNAARAEWLSRFIEKVIDTVAHKSPEDTVSLETVCLGAVTFLKQFCRVTGEMDSGARGRLIEILTELSRSPSTSGTAVDILNRVIEITATISIGHSNPRPGHAHVSHYRSGGYSGRSYTFVLGLDQNSFPGPLFQDPVILDKERQRLSSELPLSGESLDENLYSMSKILCSLNGHVYLSYSCRDLLEDREIFPSGIMLSAYRLVSGDRRGSYWDLKEYLGQPAGFVPLENKFSLNDTEWWLSKKDVSYGSDSVLACYEHLKAGETAEAGRKSDSLTEYDGWLVSSNGALDPLKNDVILSCSRLEDLAKCPFAFFIHHVLGVEPLEDLEKDPDRWLDPLQRGILLHDVFCLFMSELKSKGEMPDLSKHSGLIQSIAMDEVAEWKKIVPPPSVLTFDRELQVISLTLEIFLKDEADRCKRVKPGWFELSFGTSWGDRCGKLFEEPVKISLHDGRQFKLRGRIDRIDRVGDHVYEVWDYKTGGSYGYREDGYLNQGRHLQHALYAVAAEIVLRREFDKKAGVAISGYFFP